MYNHLGDFMDKIKIIISSCLLGNNCKYNGLNNKNDEIIKLNTKFEFIEICPEVFGGLSIPRNPSEIKDGKVISNKGLDVTSNFTSGANKALDIARSNNIKYAILKDGSPSCGSSYVYDGTFSGTKVNGYGITAKLFIENGIKVYNEKEINKLLEELKLC